MRIEEEGDATDNTLHALSLDVYDTFESLKIEMERH